MPGATNPTPPTPPAPRGPESTGPKSTGPDPAMLASPVKLLIVDDEKDITSALKRYFTFEGYEVDTANDPYTALRMIHQDNFLVVISDIAMPGMTGVELLGRIKQYNGMIQVIMITGYVTLDNVLSCLRLGADDCFLKPISDIARLQAAVDEAVGKLEKWKTLMLDISRGRRVDG